MIDLYELLTRKLYNREEEIQRDYFSVLTHILELEFEQKWQTDGYTVNGSVVILTEFKRRWNFLDKKILCKCLIQTLCYLCTLERKEGFIPQYIFLATESYYCFFETSLISEYRSIVSLETKASDAWERHPDLLKILAKNVDIPVFTVTKNIQNEILSLFDIPDNKKPIKIEAKSINTVLRLFFEFTSRDIIIEDLSTHELANIFIGILIGVFRPLEGDENILSTTIRNKPHVKIDRNKYNEFSLLSETIKDPEIIDDIVSNKSELIDQVVRRYQGEFYTPQDLVELGNYYIQRFFGKKWREENVVHEPTWGLGQLTRKYKFKHLYCSTINQEDIDFAEKLQYNNEANKFQYDWLNDDCDTNNLKYSRKLPEDYPEKISKLPLILLSNWPYGAAGDDKTEGTGKDNIANTTKIHKVMQDSSISFNKAMENLYTQCLFRCILHKKMLNKKDLHIACYCPTLFLTGPGFKELRNLFFSEFKFEVGFIVPAKVFHSLHSEWPLMFCIFSSGKQDNYTSFTLDFYDDQLKYKSTEILSNVTSNLRSWIKPHNIYLSQEKSVPLMASYINVGRRTRKEYIDVPAKWPIDVFSLLVFDSNNIEKSIKSVYILNCDIRSGLGRIKINHINFYHCMAAFTARKTSILLSNTNTIKKEFTHPDISHPSLDQFIIDSVVYALFNDSSQQASLENIKSCGQTWNINNELFWQSKDLMIHLSKKFGNRMVFNHVSKDKDRFLFNELARIKQHLSKDAKNVLNIANKLLEISFYNRDVLNTLRPRLNINRWDAGWKQIQQLIKYGNIDMKPFTEAYKEFEGRMLEETIKIGFLKL